MGARSPSMENTTTLARLMWALHVARSPDLGTSRARGFKAPSMPMESIAGPHPFCHLAIYARVRFATSRRAIIHIHTLRTTMTHTATRLKFQYLGGHTFQPLPSTPPLARALSIPRREGGVLHLHSSSMKCRRCRCRRPHPTLQGSLRDSLEH